MRGMGTDRAGRGPAPIRPARSGRDPVAMSKKKEKRGTVILETPPEIEDSDMLGGGAATEPPR